MKRRSSSDRAGQPYGPLTPERARQLIERVLDYYTDDQAAAMIELIGGLGCDPDRIRSDNVAALAMEHVFTLCDGFGDAFKSFYQRTCGAEKVADEQPTESTPAQKGGRRERTK